MGEPSDPTRRPGLDDEADGLDCFTTEGASVFDEADDRDVEFQELLPGVRIASLPATPVQRALQKTVPVPQPQAPPTIRIAPESIWRRSWPGMHVAAVALVFLLVGLIGLWMNMRRERSVMTSARPQVPVAPSITPSPAPPAPLAAAPAAPVPATPSRNTSAVASTRPTSSETSGRAAVAPATLPATPVISLEAARPADLEATAAVLIERPVVIADPEVAKAEVESPPPAAVVTTQSDRASIERVLQQYRDAYDRLDAPSAAVIWPKVDTRALNRAFSTLAEQDLSFDSCDLDIVGSQAKAHCVGEIRYVRRVGDQALRARRMSWSFAFERVSDRWQIAQVTAD